MQKILFGALFVFVMVAFSSCLTQVRTIDSVEAEAVLTVHPDQYTMYRLPEVKQSSSALWGIPASTRKQEPGLSYYINGVRIDRGGRVWSTVSLLGLTAASTALMNEYLFTKPVFGTEKGAGELFLSALVSLPVAGAINNQLWQYSSESAAGTEASNLLIRTNPGMDVYVVPRIKVQTHRGLWSQTSEVTISAIGARLNDEGADRQPEKLKERVDPPIYQADTVAEELVTLSQQRELMQANYFKVGDRVRFKVNMNTRTHKGLIEIPEGEVYRIRRDMVYIRYSFENRMRRAIKHFTEVSYSYAQLLEMQRRLNTEERIMHNYQVGDLVAFNARIMIPDVKGNFDIPKGTIVAVDGNLLIIEFSFLRHLLTARKHFSEVVPIEIQK
jgi:hypothetical protein